MSDIPEVTAENLASRFAKLLSRLALFRKCKKAPRPIPGKTLARQSRNQKEKMAFTTKDTKGTKGTKVRSKNLRILRVLRELRSEIGFSRRSSNLGSPLQTICASRGNF